MKSGAVNGPRDTGPIDKSHDTKKSDSSASKEETIKLLQDLVENLLAKIKKGDDAEKSGQAGSADKKENAQDKELLKLLMKLLKGEKLSPEEMEKLGKMLGMKPEDMKQAQGAGTENDV